MWQRRLRIHDDVTSNMFARSISVEHVEGAIVSKGWVNGSKTPANAREDGRQGSISHSSQAFYPSADDGSARAIGMAGSEFWNAVQKARHAIEGGELLGELGQTVKAVKDLSHAMVSTLFDWTKAMRKLRRRHRNNWRRYVANAGDAYLQWKFGWDPLAKDIAAIAREAELDWISVVPVNSFGVGSGTPSVNTSQTTLVGLVYDVVTVTKQRTEVRYNAGIKVQRFGIGGLVERFGVLPNDFLPTVYNLLPWTWLLDYFTNIGGMVNALSNMGVSYSHTSRTDKTIRETTVIAGSNPRTAQGLGWIDAPGYPIVSPSVTQWTSKVVQRIKAAPDAWPDLQFRFPFTSSVGGRWQAGNIAAVLAAKAFGDSSIASYGARG
jgi:hypothetical protein